MTDTRTLHMNDSLPDLHIPYPQCGHCGQDVEIDDGVAWCSPCGLFWNNIQDGEVAVPDQNVDGTEVPCEAVSEAKADPPHTDARGTLYTPGPWKPCILPSGHEGHHHHPYDVQVTPAQAGA